MGSYGSSVNRRRGRRIGAQGIDVFDLEQQGIEAGRRVLDGLVTGPPLPVPAVDESRVGAVLGRRRLADLDDAVAAIAVRSSGKVISPSPTGARSPGARRGVSSNSGSTGSDVGSSSGIAGRRSGAANFPLRRTGGHPADARCRRPWASRDRQAIRKRSPQSRVCVVAQPSCADASPIAHSRKSPSAQWGNAARPCGNIGQASIHVATGWPARWVRRGTC